MLADHGGEHRRAFSLVPGQLESPHQHGIGTSLVAPGNERHLIHDQ
jgi:hypothetical protein